MLPKRVRHIKRGTEYSVIGVAELQTSEVLIDGAEMVIYRGEDGQLWCRPREEFFDGRFEVIPSLEAVCLAPARYECVTESDGSIWYSASYVEQLRKFIGQ